MSDYRPPATGSIDKIAEMYARVEKAASRRLDLGPERSIKDPFGLQEPKVDPREAAKEMTVRLVRFFQLGSSEYGLNTEEMLFAAELAALNILNAKDIPITPARQEEIRQEAFDYYTTSLAVIPDPEPVRAPPYRRERR